MLRFHFCSWKFSSYRILPATTEKSLLLSRLRFHLTSENIPLSHSSNQQYVCSPKLLSRWTDGAECYSSCPYSGLSDCCLSMYAIVCGSKILERHHQNIFYIFNVAVGATIRECNNVVQQFGGDFVLQVLPAVCLVLANVYFCCYVLC